MVRSSWDPRSIQSWHCWNGWVCAPWKIATSLTWNTDHWFTIPETNTIRTWKWMVGIRLFRFGILPIFRCQNVGFRECKRPFLQVVCHIEISYLASNWSSPEVFRNLSQGQVLFTFFVFPETTKGTKWSLFVPKIPLSSNDKPYAWKFSKKQKIVASTWTTNHQRIQVPNLEVLYLLRLFRGWGFPYINRIHTVCIREDSSILGSWIDWWTNESMIFLVNKQFFWFVLARVSTLPLFFFNFSLYLFATWGVHPNRFSLPPLPRFFDIPSRQAIHWPNVGLGPGGLDSDWIPENERDWQPWVYGVPLESQLKPTQTNN